MPGASSLDVLHELYYNNTTSSIERFIITFIITLIITLIITFITHMAFNNLVLTNEGGM